MKNLYRVLHNIFWSLVTGERVYMLVLRPDKKRTAQYTKGMSGSLINDGYVSAVNTAIRNGEVPDRWTDEERDEFKIPPNVK